MKILIGALLAMSAGCAAAPPAEDDSAPKGNGRCDAAPAQKLIGRARSKAVAAEARRLSGAAAFRWIPEGGVATMDYREDRLNIHLDSRNRIARLDCG